MNCFLFTNGEDRDDEDGVVSRASKVSWTRSFSVASSSFGTRRSESDLMSRDFACADSLGSYEFFSHRRANDLRVFTFAELKSATRGFSRALTIGEGGFGSVYRGVVTVSDHDDFPDSKIDVAVKQLNRNGFQA
ncbi:non-specific serine,threonine protein kinase [Sarracenia purpurea var. burkii]